MLNANKLYTYITNRFVIDKSTNGWFKYDCPFCIGGDGKQKMAVHFGYQRVKCWVCGWNDTATEFVIETEGLSYIDARRLVESEEESNIDVEIISMMDVRETSEVVLPKGFNSLLSGTGSFGERARKYVTKRGFDVERLDSMGFGYCDEQHEDIDEDYFGYLIIPYRNANKLAWFQGRDFLGRGEKYKYKNPATEKFGIGKADLLFNEDALFYKRAYITEGWACAMTMGKNGTSTQGWSLSRQQSSKIMRSDCKELVFLPDRGFYAEAVKTASAFLDQKRVWVVNLDDLDPAGKLKDPNDLGLGAMLHRVQFTKELDQGMVMKVLTD